MTAQNHEIDALRHKARSLREELTATLTKLAELACPYKVGDKVTFRWHVWAQPSIGIVEAIHAVHEDNNLLFALTCTELDKDGKPEPYKVRLDGEMLVEKAYVEEDRYARND